MSEPELHLGCDVVVPDLAGWRRERMLVEPDKAFIETSPDWVCEILSPSTRRLDLGPKRRIYAGAGVPFLWFLDPDARALDAFALTGGRWLLLGTVIGGEDVSLPPFDAVTFPSTTCFPSPIRPLRPRPRPDPHADQRPDARPVADDGEGQPRQVA